MNIILQCIVHNYLILIHVEKTLNLALLGPINYVVNNKK